MKKTDDKCWGGCEEFENFVHCDLECKMICQLQKTVWQFLKILKKELLHDTATPLQGIYTKEMENLCPNKNLCMNVHTQQQYSLKQKRGTSTGVNQLTNK